MEATFLMPRPHLCVQGGNFSCNSQFRRISLLTNRIWAKPVSLELSRKWNFSSRKPVLLKEKKGVLLSDCFLENSVVRAASTESINYEQFVDTSVNGKRDLNVNGLENSASLELKPESFRNRFLNFARVGTIINDALESFFKSEIRTRLFVTAVLLVVSRLGYFIPLPGFDRRLMPENYLNFLNGSTEELGKLTPELELSLFQLGLSPQIGASILMQLLCVLLPPLVKLRKEGLDAQEKIKSYIWWISLGFAITQGLILSCYSLPYSIYAASHRVKHVIITTFYLVCGAMTMAKISDKITESGFGQGSSLIICVNILTGYTDTLHKMLTQLSGSTVSRWPYVFAVLGVFTIVTMWAVVVTESFRKIKLQYYGFKLASATREDSPITEVEPYLPFNINPSGMQPLLTTSYFFAFPGFVASIFGSRFWENVRDILNPDTSICHQSQSNVPKEISEYLNKMGARIPKIKPGKATVDYLTKIQASTRF